MKPSVYVETSVVSYLVSRPSSDAVVAGHQQTTKTWWTTALDRFDLFASQVVFLEASRGDPDAAAERLDILSEMTLLDVGRDEEELARALIAGHAVPETSAEDALHIAIAAAQGIEFLLTWNCRHIAHATAQKAIREICRNEGYLPALICTPDQFVEPGRQ